jgi:hypothetical protein
MCDESPGSTNKSAGDSLWPRKACGVKKLDRGCDLAVAGTSTWSSDRSRCSCLCRTGSSPACSVCSSVAASMSGSLDGRAPPPAEDHRLGGNTTSLHHRRSGVLGRGSSFALPGRWRSFVVRPDTLTRWHANSCRDDGVAAPGGPVVLRSIPRSRGGPSVGEGEPKVGLPQDQRRAPEAPDRRIGHNHRRGAPPGW